jgi:hypothetical protein
MLPMPSAGAIAIGSSAGAGYNQAMNSRTLVHGCANRGNSTNFDIYVAERPKN